MSWYKRAQQIYTDHSDTGKTYLDIGHEDWDYKYDEPNVIWAIINGIVEGVEESDEFPGHGEAFEGKLDVYRDWTGRFESDTGRLSVYIPYNNKISRTRNEVPQQILRLLLQKFPDTQGVYVFQ